MTAIPVSPNGNPKYVRLEIVANFIGDDPVVVEIVPPGDAACHNERYLETLELRAGGAPVFRVGMHWHWGGKTLHTVCRREGFLGVECQECRSGFSGLEVLDVLQNMMDHQIINGPQHTFTVTSLEPGRRETAQVEW